MSIIPNINNQSIAILSDIEQWKEDIADAINTKGGNSTPDESFQQLAEDIQTLPYAGISAEGIVQTTPFDFLSCYFSGFYPVVKIKDTKTIQINTNLTQFQQLKSAEFDVLERVETSHFMRTGKTLIAPKLISYKNFLAPQSVINIVLGKLENAPSITYVNAPFLRNITIGYGTDATLEFNTWTATNVIIESPSSIDELNNNLYNNLLTKLYDHSEDGQTRTLRLGWLDYVSEENIAYATAKGWTLTT